jgi:hypothetical protein
MTAGVTCPAGNITIEKHYELIMVAKEYNKTQVYFLINPESH